MERVTYLGPQGTFSEEAAQIFLAQSYIEAQLQPCTTIFTCVEAVEDGDARYAVVPLENSLEGSVHDTLDVLTTSLRMMIVAELDVDIEHNLLAVSGTQREVRQLYSHPQALGQCRNFLRRTLPDAEIIPVLSTAQAAEIVAAKGAGTAAIASVRAAGHYGLQNLASGIQDTLSRTRFVVLGNGESRLGEAVKTSVLFSVKNAAGSLFRVLQAFARHKVNLTRIESRPAKSRLGEYIFFVDLDGTPDQADIKAALREASQEAVMLKLLGAYPVLDSVAGV
ncbi:MAG: prephenate dehydratase [Firmicutes bacterium]|nr:prephenate dehydratase [Bacillota bacterium]